MPINIFEILECRGCLLSSSELEERLARASQTTVMVEN